MKLRYALAVALSFAIAPVSSLFADVYLGGEEVAKIVTGNTIQGQYRDCTAGRNDFIEYYAEDGTIRGKERPCNHAGSWTRYQGFWSVEDGKFCVQLGRSNRSDGCFDYQADAQSTLRRVNEPGVGNTNFQIFDGNPENL